MSYKEPQTETEILSADEQKVREMCLSLKKIEAPKDFDFKLKARIAKANPRDFRPRFGFAFRYALPVLAMVFVLGFLAYSSGMFSFSKNNLTIAENSPEIKNPSLPQNTLASAITSPKEPESTNENPVISNSNQNLPKVSENQVAGIKPNKSEIERTSNVKSDDSTRSEDKAFKSTNVIQPRFEQKSPIQAPQNNEKINPLTVKNVLSINGINADFENGKWTVKSVTANGIGESSGIKENDIIEAIDNQPLSVGTVFNKTATGKTITVTRGGEKLEIKLRNKQ